MAVSMLMDKYSPKFLGILSLLALVILFFSVMVGVLGPSARDYTVYYAYDCPNNSHTWANDCNGVQLSQPNTQFTFELPSLNTLNKFWSLILFPYPSSSSNQNERATGVETSLSVLTTIYYYDEEWKPYDSGNVGTTELLLCEPGQDICWGFILAFEDKIKYSKYAVSVSFPDDSDNDIAKSNIGDVAFQLEWNNEYFSVIEMSVRVTYLVIATVCIITFWYQTKAIPFSLLSLEQKFISILLIGVICLNNPFYPFEYLISGPFFPVLDCFLVTVHQIILVSFWLFSMDIFRRDGELKLQVTAYDIPKLVLVSIFGVFNFVIFVWFRLFDQSDPIMGQVHHVSGLVALFFINIFIFAGIIIWAIILAVLTFTVVKKDRPEQLVRYSVILVPSAFVILSIVLGLFFGTFGPIQREAPGFIYFFTLYNLYVWILLIAYWPVTSSFTSSNIITESTPIKVKPDSNNNNSEFGPTSDNLFGEDDTL